MFRQHQYTVLSAGSAQTMQGGSVKTRMGLGSYRTEIFLQLTCTSPTTLGKSAGFYDPQFPQT